jgi:hypothetical protein
MAALWKYDMVVMDAAASKDREEAVWEIGRTGWELVAVLPGDWKNGETADLKKMTWFLKRQATHDINF